MPATIQSIHRPTRARGLDTSTSIQKISSTNLVTNGDFSPDSDWPTQETGWAIIGGYAVFSGTDYKYIGQSVSITAGKMYKLTFTITTTSGNPFVVILGGEPAQHFTSAGTYTIDIMAGSDNTELRFYAGSTGTRWNGTVDNVELYAAEAFRNNNHGQIYSGRALEFDGVSDYLSVGTSGDKKFVDYTAETTAANRAWTVAVWFNFDAVGTTVQTLSGVDDSDDTAVSNYLRITSNEKLGFWDLGGAALREANTILNPNTWYRAVFVYNGSDTVNFYVNGVADGSGTLTAGENNNADLNVSIIGGALESSSLTKIFAGKMSDFQAWQGAWTQDDVTYDYLNPEQLVLNRGGTSLTNSNLKLWYPMNDGHRGNQSYVLDASNTGLGEEMVTNSDFETDSSGGSSSTSTQGTTINNWTLVYAGGSGSGATLETFNETSPLGGTADMKLTNASAGENAGMVSNAISFVNGVTYKVSYQYKTSGGNAYGKIADSAANTGGVNIAGSTQQTLSSTSGSTNTYYFTATETETNYVTFFAGDGITIEVDNVSVKPVNDKNNATTAFYGDERIDAEKNRIFASTSNWTNRASSNDWDTYNEDATSGATEGTYFTDNYLHLEVTSDGANVKGAYLDGQYWEDTSHGGVDMVVGRTYRLSYSIEITAYTSGTLNIGFANASHAMSSNATKAYTATKTAATDYIDFVYEGTTNHAEMLINAATSSAFTVYFDNISLKEVGTATGWTDADQQLDIPQTALQSYNQLAWFDGVADYTTIADHNDFSFGDGTNDSAFSLSSWIFVNEATHFPIMGKNTSSHREWLLYIDQNDKLAIILLDNSTSANQGRYYDAAWPHTGKWAHVAATYDGNEADADAGLKLYINGERVDDENTTSGSYTAMENKDGVVAIGASLHGSNYANGAITESCIWNKELSQAEVEELYNDGLALDATTHSTSSDLIGYWRNNGIATWQDLTANNRDGTPTSVTETMLITEGVDSSRDSQGLIMNRQRTTNSLNLFTNYIADGIGNGERVVVPGRIALGTSDFSVSFWVYKHQDWQEQWVVSQFVDSSNRWYIRANESNPPRLHIFARSGGNTVIDVADTSTSLDSYLETWMHVVCTVDRDGSAKIYLNASEITSGAVESGQHSTSLTFDVDLNIGWYDEAARDDHHFNGQIDDVLIYSDVVSADEVKRIYNAGKRSHR